MMIRHVPNLLTTLRILLAPAFVAAFSLSRPGLALALFLLGALTDMLDGQIARRCHCVSNLGKALDPLADKLTLVGILLCLYMAQRVPLWLLIVIAARELLMILCGALLWKRRVEFAADRFGKITTVLFFAATVLLFPWHDDPRLLLTGEVLLLASVVSSLAAICHYARLFLPALAPRHAKAE